MPTVDDLREAFAELERRAPQTCDVAPRPRIPMRPILVAAAVLVVVAAITVGVRLSGHRVASDTGSAAGSSTAPVQPPAPQAGLVDPPLGYTFGVRSAPDSVAIDLHTGADYQAIQVRARDRVRSASPVLGTVVVYPAPGYQPRRPAHARDVSVAGSPGFAGRIEPGPGMAGRVEQPLLALAWRDTQGGWAVAQWQGPVATSPTGRLNGLQTLAARVDFAAAHFARVPVAFRQVPLNLALNSVTGFRQDDTLSTELAFADYTQRRAGLDVEISTGGESVFSKGGPTGRSVAFGDFSGYYDRRCGALYLDGPGGVSVAISSDVSVIANQWHPAPSCPASTGVRLPSFAELRGMVAGLRFAPDPADPATWFAVAHALPAHAR